MIKKLNIVSVQHDPPRCTPEGSQPKYIMFPSATNNGLQEFSECSRESIGQTLDVRSGLCFIQSMHLFVFVNVCLCMQCMIVCVIQAIVINDLLYYLTLGPPKLNTQLV